jgi:hypothetical protein
MNLGALHRIWDGDEDQPISNEFLFPFACFSLAKGMFDYFLFFEEKIYSARLPRLPQNV